jgi:hypothetical protein
VTWGASSASWDAMSNSTQSGLQILLPLVSGTAITQITQNFVNWWSPRNVVIVGHLTGVYGQTNQPKTNRRHRLCERGCKWRWWSDYFNIFYVSTISSSVLHDGHGLGSWSHSIGHQCNYGQFGGRIAYSNS